MNEKGEKIPFENNLCGNGIPSLDFVYFSWKEVETITKYSRNLYLSEYDFDYKKTIHNDRVSKNRSYKSYKIEGDFLIKSGKRSDLPIPMFYLGTPCPPRWQTEL